MFCLRMGVGEYFFHKPVFLCLKATCLVFYTRAIVADFKELSPKLSIKIPGNIIAALFCYVLI